jgi:hypothetical protein
MTKNNRAMMFDYINIRLSDMILAINNRFEQNEKQVERAERTLNERLASVNEFRLVLTDQQKLLVNRTEYQNLSDRVDRIESRLSLLEGRGKGLSAGWGYLVGAIGLIVGFITILSIDLI